MSVLAPPKPQSPPPRRGSAPGRPRRLVIQPDTLTRYAQSIAAKLLALGRTQVAGPYRERYIARLLDEDPAMTQIFLGVVQTVWPLLDNTTRAKILMLTTTDKVHAWIRVHHPETQP